MGQSLDQVVREHTRRIRRQTMDIKCEILGIERAKATVAKQIKRAAKDNEIDLVKIYVREFVMHRNSIKKLNQLKAQMSGFASKMQLMKSNHGVQTLIRDITHTMKAANRSLGLGNIQEMIMEYSRENALAEEASEAFGEMLEGDVDSDEEDELVDSVLDEIGVTIAHQLQEAPDTVIENELEARLAQLRH